MVRNATRALARLIVCLSIAVAAVAAQAQSFSTGHATGGGILGNWPRLGIPPVAPLNPSFNLSVSSRGTMASGVLVLMNPATGFNAQATSFTTALISPTQVTLAGPCKIWPSAVANGTFTFGATLVGSVWNILFEVRDAGNNVVLSGAGPLMGTIQVRA